MKKNVKDRKTDIDDTRVLPLEEIINMRRRIHDEEIEEEDTQEVNEPVFTGKSTFVLDTSNATQLRRDALEHKEKQEEEHAQDHSSDNEIEAACKKETEKDVQEYETREAVEQPQQNLNAEDAVLKEHEKLTPTGDEAKSKESTSVEETEAEILEEKSEGLKKQDDAEETKCEDKEKIEPLVKDAHNADTSSNEQKTKDEEPVVEKVTQDSDKEAIVVKTSETDHVDEISAKPKTECEKNDATLQTLEEAKEEEDSKTMELASVKAQEEHTDEEKRKKEIEKKQTLEDKRAIDLQKATIEEKRKKELEHALTLEEKRKQQLENKMTLEEKRALRKQVQEESTATSSHTFASYFQSLKALDIVSIVLLCINIVLDGYLSWRINTYFSLSYAAIFFFMILLVLSGIFVLMVKKQKIGLVLNILAVLLLGTGSIMTMRLNSFTDTVLDNSESETVMIVAKKDAAITEDSDLKDKRIAMIKIDGDANTFAEEILAEHKKSGYVKETYPTYKEAYDALMNDQTDLMVYTGLARQRLSDDEIDSWSNVKVIFQKNRKLEAVEGNKVDILKDPFTVLVSGVDLTSNSINEKGSSDVNILLVVNPNTKRIMMQTIPRDTWAPLTCSNNEHTKLTYAGAYGGTDCSIKTIEQYLDVEINYYAKINFKGVIDLVDAMGGITVNSDVSFCESHPLDGYGVRDYCYNAGANDLTGVEALMFSRIRKVFSNGDLERGNHQMEVINAVVRKFKEEPSLSHLNSLMSAVENNFTTNLEEDDLGKCLELFLGMSDQLNTIESYSMEGETAWNTDEVTNEYLYYFYPNDGQIEAAQERIDAVLDGK